MRELIHHSEFDTWAKKNTSSLHVLVNYFILKEIEGVVEMGGDADEEAHKIETELLELHHTLLKLGVIEDVVNDT